MLSVVTWNVNGIRARWDEVTALVAERRPAVLCLQEIKASAAQIPEPLTGLPEFWNLWHGGPGGYSGVSVHVARRLCPEPPELEVPDFDVETRIACARIPGGPAVASVYVPNGRPRRKGEPAMATKMRFLAALAAWADERRDAPLIVAGDLNVALTERDLHPKHRAPGSVGQSDAEREALTRVIEAGLVDLIRARHPEADDLFTWWPPWREEKAKNRGWRIDFVLASEPLAARVERVEVLRDFGTSDHAPVLVELAGGES